MMSSIIIPQQEIKQSRFQTVVFGGFDIILRIMKIPFTMAIHLKIYWQWKMWQLGPISRDG